MVKKKTTRLLKKTITLVGKKNFSEGLWEMINAAVNIKEVLN